MTRAMWPKVPTSSPCAGEDRAFLGAREPAEVVDGRRRPCRWRRSRSPRPRAARPARRRSRRRRGSRRSGSRCSGSGRGVARRSRASSSASVRFVVPSASSRAIAAWTRRALSVASAWSVTWSENEIRPTSVVVKSHRSRNARAAAWASTSGCAGHARRDVDQQVDPRSARARRCASRRAGGRPSQERSSGILGAALRLVWTESYRDDHGGYWWMCLRATRFALRYNRRRPAQLRRTRFSSGLPRMPVRCARAEMQPG